jgi:hypothetical protein
VIGTDTLFRAASTGAQVVGGAISLSLRLARAPVELIGGLAEGLRHGEERPPDTGPAGEPYPDRRDLDADAPDRAATVVLERDDVPDIDPSSWETEAARGDVEEELLTAAAGDEPPSPAEMREAGRQAAEEDETLVGEYADPGAETGAGPELTVEPPWEGYDDQTATEIRQSLSDASPAAAGAVQLYESSHRARASVLRAAERAMKGSRAGANGR